MSATQRRLTVMFADVSGSTALSKSWATGKPCTPSSALPEADEPLDRRLQRKDHQIVGDELLASFENAEEACQAAIDMQQRIADLPPVSGLKLTIRIGLHSGVVAVSEGKLGGPAVATAARIAGIARRDQILCSSELVAELPQPGIITVDAMPKLGTVAENGVEYSLFQIHWPSYQGGSYRCPPSGRKVTCRPTACAFVTGARPSWSMKTPVLTIGRDLACKLAIDDRKGIRQHARVERRNDGFYLVDTSTNGTFVTLAGRHELMVRRNEMQLDGRARSVRCLGKRSC